ncbi:Benzoate 4-monooxygenase cytochrome P450 [Penicillium malachiteum]|uniref:Benzoate 4-monooxygenase cytochrome P450 n=1 Tax=Penicillium malachiteum TaxID=1324776 RepID=UPI0025467DAD|nr:Benzoate 4-monooxygenase cytochrome P450 [Penicillium malachiteum]KAJ5713013.1 Benzoate 4-monooxygenase cytochrome P450 [Penicillium malachiteum]
MEYIFLYPLIAAALLLFFGLRIIFYRLYAHPLSSFPGPKLAAATFLYEFYYDVIRNGMYIWEIERMHEKYGPIVRINPRELHIKDPYYYEDIHASGARKRNRDPQYAVAYGAPYSLVGTIQHDHHRLRRTFIQNYFSKRSVSNLTPYIWEKVDQLIQRFERAYKESSVLHLQLDFGALTADVITQYCYGWNYGYLNDTKNATRVDLVDAVSGLMLMFHINRFLPFLVTIFRTAPPGVVRFLQPRMGDLFDVKARLREQSIAALKDKKSEDKDETNKKDEKSEESNSIFDALVGENVPAEEKTVDRLVDEAALLLGAGTETTARSLAVSMFHVINNKEIGRKLREELKTVLEKPTSKASWTDLEQLSYLTGVVNEGLRLSHGMTARLSRISPIDPMLYKDWVIPAGTPVSQSNYFVHMDPTLFPEPEKFDPDRWTRAADKGEHLSRFIVSFTKGSKQCLGMNLAYAEIYMTLAHIVRRFEFTPHETTPEDLAVRRSMGVGVSMDCKFDVKAKVVGIVEE